MIVSVLLFASYADAFGGPRIEVPIEPPCEVRSLIDAMRGLPGGGRLPVRPLVAVNQSWASPTTAIGVGDEVALIPPVAGG